MIKAQYNTAYHDIDGIAITDMKYLQSRSAILILIATTLFIIIDICIESYQRSMRFRIWDKLHNTILTYKHTALQDLYYQQLTYITITPD